MKELLACDKIVLVLWLPLFVASGVLSCVGFALENFVLFLTFKALFVPLLSFFVYIKWTRPLTKPYYLLQLALASAWMGDVLLAFGRVHPMYFMLGASFFLIQQNWYIWLNLTSKGHKGNIWRAPFWGLPNLVYVVLFSLVYIAEIDKILRAVCLIYTFCLATAFLTAFHRDTNSRNKYWMTVIGFFFFVLSDILIALDSFLYPFSPLAATSILITYYIAQTLICCGHLPLDNKSPSS
jgi:hypothetical protein